MADTVERPSTSDASRSTWIVLFYQLPTRHAPARVKAWRRLQRIGAVTLKNSAYVLPNSPEAREDLEWIRTEIIGIGGQAMIMAAEALDDATRQEIIELFRTARGQDFKMIRRQAQSMLDRWRARVPSGPARRRLMQNVRRLRERFQELEAIDFFDAPDRTEAARILDELDQRARGGLLMTARQAPSKTPLDINQYRGRVWVTRPRPGVDRMSSAWLIRRFVDPNAKFAFGDASGQQGAIPFDMFGAEFGHHETRCTFETIAERFGVDHPAVAWLGRVVHDLDLKEDTYGVPEKAAVGRMVEGLRRMYPDDKQLLDAGITLFEALCQSHAEQQPPPHPAAAPARKPLKSRAPRRRPARGRHRK